MADLREKLDKLRTDAADFVLMSRRSSDPQKRALFERLADELAIEALELEQVVKLQSRRSGHSDMDKVVPLHVRPDRRCRSRFPFWATASTRGPSFTAGGLHATKPRGLSGSRSTGQTPSAAGPTGALLRPIRWLGPGRRHACPEIALETEESLALSVANNFPGPIGSRLLCRLL